jgi:signal transduction histidine kinase
MGYWRRNLTTTITRYYLSFFLMIPTLVMLSAGLAHSLAVRIAGSMGDIKLDAASIAQSDFSNISAADVLNAGGWVEVLKDGKVVYILGNKLDDKMEYSDADLHITSQMKFTRKLATTFSDSEYYHSTALFTDGDGEEYLCLVKIPKKNMENSISGLFNTTNPVMRFERMLLLNLVGTVVIFCMFFFMSIFIYGRITARKIARPLEAIGRGIAAITKGDLTTRMDFEAEKEFENIRDAFNYMSGRLETADREKREMEENRKRLIMGISHDLKTPITTVYGYAKALTDGIVQDPEKQQRHLVYIRDKALTMTKLIDDLFKYSSIEGSEYELHPKREDFAEFLRELIAENYLEIENKGFGLDLDIPETPVVCAFDRAEMHRALTNIIGNSIKYNAAGTTLIVTLAQEGTGIRLTMGDDGIGISDEIKSTVFNEFVRGDAARVSDGGSGLGLAIAKRIIEMHRGSISLDAGAGKGVRFVIVLPTGG